MRYYPVQKKKYAKGEIIFSEDSQCDGMYIIASGRVRVFKTMDAGDSTKEIELCTLGPKAMFGEMAMIDDNPRSASVQAVTPVVCTLITRTMFEDQLLQIPVWMVNMIKILVTRLRETNDKLRGIIQDHGPDVVEDTGRVITVDEDPMQTKESNNSTEPDSGMVLELKHFKSDEIVKGLLSERNNAKTPSPPSR